MSEDTPRVILYFGERIRVNCDRNCGKAWGINHRPKNQLSDDPDDYEYLADGELGEAPADPGTYEFFEAKPLSPSEFPNRWCVRECERCARGYPGDLISPVALRDFSKRVRNIVENTEVGDETLSD